MLASLREAESLAQAVDDGRRLARVWAHMVSPLWWMGQLESAVDYGQRALAIAADLGDRSLEILARARLGMAYLYLGEHRRVINVVRPCIEALSGDLARERFEMAALPAVMGRGYLAISLASLGDFVSASTMSEEAIAIAKAADHPYSVAVAHFQEGRWRALQGNFSAAIPALELSIEACRREGFYVFTAVAAFLGGAYARVGRLADGIALLQESMERETAIGFMVHRPANLAFLAEAYLLSGRFEEARQTAHQALDLSRTGKRRGFEADALYILGEIESRQDPPDRVAAEEFYRQALALAEELGLRPLVAHCDLGLANLYGRTGKWQEAQDHLTTAMTMYREMGMSFWLEKAEAAAQDIDAHAHQTP
jgi:tetratricopeptide (TPR) repeat protein